MDEAVAGKGAFEVVVEGLVGEATDAVQQMKEDFIKEPEDVANDREESVRS